MILLTTVGEWRNYKWWAYTQGIVMRTERGITITCFQGFRGPSESTAGPQFKNHCIKWLSPSFYFIAFDFSCYFKLVCPNIHFKCVCPGYYFKCLCLSCYYKCVYPVCHFHHYALVIPWSLGPPKVREFTRAATGRAEISADVCLLLGAAVVALIKQLMPDNFLPGRYHAYIN